MSGLLTDQIRAMIGAERTYPAKEEIGGMAIRYFAIAVGDTDPLYYDDEYARAQGYPSRIAPPTFITESGQYAGNTPNAHGYLPHEWDWPAGFRTIRGGQDYTFARPVLPTDRISVRYRLESIEEKSSRDGRGQLLAISLAEFIDADGAVVATNRELFFLQPLATKGAA
ncbi:MaoC family dehydratase N-terminal domain-containing protein [Pseudooceanicola sp. MF1-13]|uniref:FAS1-like dehydratase domain-containing protein n=1 Tax=Pseudooceanicola sp. MF1-13 TaxID=3379095 RepID=UPI00389276AC